jgi:Cu+-exporting ATPase
LRKGRSRALIPGAVDRPEKGETMGLDPVCKMEVNPASAAAQSEYEGQVFYFCSKECKRKFDANPTQYLDETDRAEGQVHRGRQARRI